MACQVKFLFWTCLCTVGSCICMVVAFLSLGKFSPMIWLKIWSMEVSWDSSTSSMPAVLKFSLFMMSHNSCTFFFCDFLKNINSLCYLVKILYIILEPWYSLFCLIHSTLKLEFLHWIVMFSNSIICSAWVLFSVPIFLLNAALKYWIVSVLSIILMFVFSQPSLSFSFPCVLCSWFHWAVPLCLSNTLNSLMMLEILHLNSVSWSSSR